LLIVNYSGCVTGEKELDLQSVSVAVVGADQGFEMIEGDRMQAYLDAVEVTSTVQYCLHFCIMVLRMTMLLCYVRLYSRIDVYSVKIMSIGAKYARDGCAMTISSSCVARPARCHATLMRSCSVRVTSKLKQLLTQY
jgi:hypothetical protein